MRIKRPGSVQEIVPSKNGRDVVIDWHERLEDRRAQRMIASFPTGQLG